MSPAEHAFALKLSHLHQVFEDLGGAPRMSFCISASIHLPLSFLFTSFLLCGPCVGLCSVIPMTDQRCQPKRSLCLFFLLQMGLNCQVDNSQDPSCSLSLSLFLSLSVSRAHCLFPWLPTPVHLHPQTSENQ